MRKLIKAVYLFLFSVVMVYGQSSIDVGTGSMITIDTANDISAGSRSGCFTGKGTFNGQPLIGIPTVSITTDTGQTSFSVNWNAVSGATGYILDVATDSNFGAGTIITGYDSLDVGNVITYSITGLTAGTVYYYRIRAYELCAISRFSDTLSMVTVPANPVAAAATLISDTGLTANWNTVAGVSHYYLDISTDASFGAGTFVSGYSNLNVGNVITRVVTGLSPNLRYYYRVRASNASGTSGNSNTIDTMTLTAAPLAKSATDLRTDSLTANWASVTGADTYFLDVSTDPAFGPGAFVSGYHDLNVGNITTRVVTGLSPNLRYYYRVRAHNTSGISANSNVIDTLTLPDTPDALPATAIAGTTFTANWALPSDAAGYYLDIAIDSIFTHYVTDYQNRDVGHVTAGLINTGILTGTTYYYRVRSYNNAGTSGHSDTIRVTTLTAAPTALAASSVLSSAFNTNWTHVTGADTYYLDVSTDAAFGPGAFVSGFNHHDNHLDTTCQVNGLTAGIRYYYRVRASNTTGISENSNVIDQMTIPEPPVADTVRNIQTSGFTIIWNASAGSSGYQLDIATDSAFNQYVSGYQNLDVGNSTQYTAVNQLQAGTSYYIRVSAYNPGGTSDHSNLLQTVTLPDPPVAKPACEVWSTDFVAAWTPSSGATEYQIDVATDMNFTQLLTDYMSLDVGDVDRFKIDKGIQPGTHYFYRLRASNASGVSGYSAAVDVLTSPNPPVATEATAIHTNGFTANWNPSQGATGYRLDIATREDCREFVPDYHDKDVGNVTSFVMTGLTSNANYYYRLRAYNTGSGSLNSNLIHVSTQNASPVLAGLGTDTLIFYTGGLQLPLATTITITDDNPTLTGATIRVSNNYIRGQDLLDYVQKDGITKTWNGMTGVMTLTGSATVAQYQEALRRVKYVNMSMDPTIQAKTISFNAQDEYSTSNTLSRVVQVLGSIPDIVIAREAEAITPNGFTARWYTSIMARGYNIDIATDSNFIHYVEGYRNLDVAKITSYPVSNLMSLHAYYYRIRAYNEWGISANSNIISVTTSVMPINAPSNLTAHRIPDGRILLQWIDQSDNETGFIMERKTSDETEFSIIQNLDANMTEINLDPIGTGLTAQFRIKAFNDQTESEYSNIADLQEMIAPLLSRMETDTIDFREGSSAVLITTDLMIQDLDSPELQGATITIADHYTSGEDQLLFTGTNGISGQWDSSRGVLSLTGSASIDDYQTALHQIQYCNPAINTTRLVKSIAFCVFDGYLSSNIAPRLIRIVSPINSPSNVQAAICSGGIQLHWQDNSTNEQGFIITRLGMSGGNIPYSPQVGNPVYITIDSVQSGTSSYLDSKIMEGESYLYRIIAYDSQGSLSDITDQCQLTNPITYPPYRPGNLTGTCTDNVICLNWIDYSAIEQGFILERSENDNQHYSERFRPTVDITAFVDSGLVNGIIYYYRLSAYKDTLVSPVCDEISVTGVITAISEAERGIPKDYLLSQNYPNPFNPSTTISYALPKAGTIRLSICNLLGQEIITLIDRSVTEGYHHLVFNADGLKSGIYFYRLETQEKVLIKKMILMK